MRIVGIGAGPANLYFGILMKKAFPDVEISLFERNAPGATFGWGVVFSDETLSHFDTADSATYEAIKVSTNRDTRTSVDGDTVFGNRCDFIGRARSRWDIDHLRVNRCSDRF